MDITLTGSGDTPTFTVPVNGAATVATLVIIKKCTVNVKIGDPPGFVPGLRVSVKYDGAVVKPAKADYYQAHGYIFKKDGVETGNHTLELTFTTEDGAAKTSPVKLELQQIVGR